MPIPKAVARFNRKVTNPVLGRLAPWVPGLAILTHVGRTSGIVRRTPVYLFRNHGRTVIAVTYGPETQWVQNVLAAGGCTVETRRRHRRLTKPVLVHEPSRRMVPWFIRVPLVALNAADFLVLEPAEATTSARAAS